VATADAQTYPAYRSYFGMHIQEGPAAAGLVIDQVGPNTPASEAGLKPGDVLLAIDGRPVTSSAQAADLMDAHPPYDAMKMAIERAGQRLALEATPTGALRLEALNPKKVFYIPGIDTVGPFVVSSPVDSLDRMNVLERVLVDPVRGQVEFIGTYDPAYDTGPVPYRQLLQAALRFPEPGFSLDTVPESLGQLTDLLARRDSDLARVFGPGTTPQQTSAWFRRWVNLILAHPLLELDRQNFLGKMAGLSGLTKAELVTLFNYANMDGVTRPVPEQVLDIQVRLLDHAGFKQTASAYRLYRLATTGSLLQAADVLGQGEEARRLVGAPEAAAAPAATRLALLQAFVTCRLARSVNYLNDQQAGAYLVQFQEGKLPIDRLDTWLQRRIIPDRDAAGHYLVYQTLDGLPLSNELLGLFFGVTVPQSVLRFSGVDADSALGRALYEADYALKTVDMTQEIFHTISGHRTYKQMCLDAHLGKLSPVRWTLVPQDVPLLVSADRREVGFGRAEIALDAHATRIENGGTFTDEDLAATQKLADVYRAQVNGGYEQYAREYASLHRLREAAKILALARWINDERIPVSSDLRPASAEAVAAAGESGLHAWTPPSRVPGLYHVFMSLAEVTTPDGRKRQSIFIPTGVEGGVSFKGQKKWVSISPMPPTYEKAAESLTTSVALGQAAVKAAVGGDLELARSLADKSAEAMQGRLNLSMLPKNVPIPKVPVAAASPEAARVVKEADRIVHSMADSGPAGRTTTADTAQRTLLADLGRELNNVASGAPVGTNFFSMLQTRQSAPAPAARPLAPPAGQPLASPPPAAAPAPPVCDALPAGSGEGEDLDAAQKARFDAKIAQITQDLERVQRAMANIGRLNQQNVAELQKWEKEVSAAYGAAEERAMDAAGLLLVDGPLEILRKRQQQMREAMDSGILTSLLARKAAVTGEEAAALDRQAFGFLKMKYRYEGVYGQAERLGQHLAGAKAGYDMDQWANGDKNDFEKMKAGMMQLVELALGEPAIGGAISVGRITSENLLRLLSLYKAVNLAAGFLGDIVAQRLAWGPVMEQLERSIDTNRQGLEHLRQRAVGLRQQLECLESASGRD
jgi:hypothetical protein